MKLTYKISAPLKFFIFKMKSKTTPSKAYMPYCGKYLFKYNFYRYIISEACEARRERCQGAERDIGFLVFTFCFITIPTVEDLKVLLSSTEFPAAIPDAPFMNRQIQLPNSPRRLVWKMYFESLLSCYTAYFVIDIYVDIHNSNQCLRIFIEYPLHFVYGDTLMTKILLMLSIQLNVKKLPDFLLWLPNG